MALALEEIGAEARRASSHLHYRLRTADRRSPNPYKLAG